MVVSAVQVAKRALLATMRAAAAMFGLTILPVHILPDGWGCDLQMSASPLRKFVPSCESYLSMDWPAYQEPTSACRVHCV